MCSKCFYQSNYSIIHKLLNNETFFSAIVANVLDDDIVVIEFELKSW